MKRVVVVANVSFGGLWKTTSGRNAGRLFWVGYPAQNCSEDGDQGDRIDELTGATTQLERSSFFGTRKKLQSSTQQEQAEDSRTHTEIDIHNRRSLRRYAHTSWVVTFAGITEPSQTIEKPKPVFLREPAYRLSLLICVDACAHFFRDRLLKIVSGDLHPDSLVAGAYTLRADTEGGVCLWRELR